MFPRGILGESCWFLLKLLYYDPCDDEGRVKSLHQLLHGLL